MHTLQKKNVYRLFWIRRLSIAIFFILLADMQMAYAWYPVCKQDTVNISCLHACSRWQARQLSGPHTAERIPRNERGDRLRYSMSYTKRRSLVSHRGAGS